VTAPPAAALAAARQPLPLFTIATAFAVAALAVLFLAPMGTRFGLWGLGVGRPLFLGAAWLALAAGVLAVVAVWRTGRVVRSLAVVVIAAAAAAAPVRLWLSERGAPRIHDISTDLEHPPAYVAIARLRGPGANPVAYGGAAVAGQQRASYADLRPLIVAVPPDRTLALAADTARAQGWTVVAQDLGFGNLGRLEATDTTLWFGRVDDVVVRVVPHPVGSRVDVRSSARDDAADGGRNAQRIRRFLAFLAERARVEEPRNG
jgi:uncharacterized protein DUF1499